MLSKIADWIKGLLGDDEEEDDDIPMSLMARKATGIWPKSDPVGKPPAPLVASEIRALREYTGLSPEEFADFNGAENGEMVLAWERGEERPNAQAMHMLLQCQASKISYRKS